MKKAVLFVLCTFLAFSSVLGVYADTSTDESFLIDNMLSSYQDSLSKWGKDNFYGYCSAFVNYQLFVKNINTNYVALNGNQVYPYYSHLSKSSGGYLIKSFPSEWYSLSMVLNYLNSDKSSNAKFPTVLGFKKGSASDEGQKYGHAMMIYEVLNGYVFYNDTILPNPYDNIYKKSISEFLDFYSDKPDTEKCEFVFDGAIQFIKEKPICAKIETEKSTYALWEDINFKVSSHGAITYLIGIDRDGERITTLNLGAIPFSKLNIGERGTYTAYVSACNPFGFVDSEKIEFYVN